MKQRTRTGQDFFWMHAVSRVSGYSGDCVVLRGRLILALLS